MKQYTLHDRLQWSRTYLSRFQRSQLELEWSTFYILHIHASYNEGPWKNPSDANSSIYFENIFKPQHDQLESTYTNISGKTINLTCDINRLLLVVGNIRVYTKQQLYEHGACVNGTSQTLTHLLYSPRQYTSKESKKSETRLKLYPSRENDTHCSYSV